MDSNSAPLADYFWIAGIESISYQDFPLENSLLPSTTHVDTTIEEDKESEEEQEEEDVSHNTNRDSVISPVSRIRDSRQSAGSRLSKISTHTLEELDGNTRSNRSSATIRPNPLPGAAVQDGLVPSFLADFDFDKALLKFASERENFLEDLSFTAGAKTQARQPMVNNPRAERIKADESGRMSPLKTLRGSIRGSIRRKISFRDMNSARKPPAAPRPGMTLSLPFSSRWLLPLSLATLQSLTMCRTSHALCAQARKHSRDFLLTCVFQCLFVRPSG
jgi:hypothetical protein